MQTEPTVILEEITPARAGELLKQNHANRKVRRLTAVAYARDMSTGNWKITGEPIKLDPDGNLLDGQHRLTALILAGKPVRMHVAYGVDPDSQKAMDTGMKRTASDMLIMQGYQYATTIAAVARIAVSAQRKLPLGKTFVTHAETQQWVEDNPEFIKNLRRYAYASDRLQTVPKSILVYTYYVLDQEIGDADKVDAFFESLISSVGRYPNDPAVVAARRLNDAYRNREKWFREMHYSLLIRAWNYWIKDESVAKFQIKNRNDELIKAPKIVKG